MKQLKLPFDMTSEYEKLAKELTNKQKLVSNGRVIYYYENLLKRIKEVGTNGWYVETTEGGFNFGCILWKGDD